MIKILKEENWLFNKKDLLTTIWKIWKLRELADENVSHDQLNICKIKWKDVSRFDEQVQTPKQIHFTSYFLFISFESLKIVHEQETNKNMMSTISVFDNKAEQWWSERCY